MLALAASLIVFASLWYTNVLVNKIAKEERGKIKLWAEAIEKKNDLVNYTIELFDKLGIEEEKKAELSSIKKMILRIPIFGKILKNLLKPEFLLPDYMLGISNRYYAAIRKTRDDLITDGKTEESRNWDHYEEF